MDPRKLKRLVDGPAPPQSGLEKARSSKDDLATFNRVRDALEWRKTYDPERDGNPPSFVDDEALWEKAKHAAEESGADDIYAFANWWYHEHGG